MKQSGANIALSLMGLGILTGMSMLGGCHQRSSRGTAAKDALVDQLNTYGGPATARLKLSGSARNSRKAELPGKISGTGWHIPWYEPDPKKPEAGLQRRLIADAVEGEMDAIGERSATKTSAETNTVGGTARDTATDSNKDCFVITLKTVTATLYQDNQPATSLKAPIVTLTQSPKTGTSPGDHASAKGLPVRIVVASGGVHIQSNRDVVQSFGQKTQANSGKRSYTPSDGETHTTIVTADKMEWRMDSSKLLCTGHAVLTVQQQTSGRSKGDNKKGDNKKGDNSGNTSTSIVRAEQMEWDMSESLLTCTGNPVLTIDQTDTPKITQYAPRITYSDKTHLFRAGN